jgi:hypothetical protein
MTLAVGPSNGFRGLLHGEGEGVRLQAVPSPAAGGRAMIAVFRGTGTDPVLEAARLSLRPPANSCYCILENVIGPEFIKPA